MPPGTSEVKHFHQQAWQFFLVLSGNATLEISGDRQALYTYEGIEVPSGVPHQMFNDSEADVEFLIFSQPPSHKNRFVVDSVELSLGVHSKNKDK